MRFDNDSLGQRMKFYEGMYDQSLLPLLPAICRLDGRAFHSFTKGLKRPFDVDFANLMDEVAKWLMVETGAIATYVQSDEISLIWFQETYKSQLFFNGRIQKLQSVLASQCSVHFNKLLHFFIPAKNNVEPVFDCRVWSVPIQEEAVNYLIWRQNDCTRNSISMAAQSCFSHKQLMHKDCDEMQEMMFQEKGVNWSKYPPRFKNGMLVRKVIAEVPFSAEEIDKLPPKHEARKNPDLKIERQTLESSFDVLTKLSPLDRISFIFGRGIKEF